MDARNPASRRDVTLMIINQDLANRVAEAVAKPGFWTSWNRDVGPSGQSAMIVF